jgi:eukaryotic-like serine/threonine-protein kinase
MVDRARMPTLGLPAPGERFGPFDLLLEIARGGMAVVFLARRGDGAPRALKVILPHLADDRDFVDMFLDEARICASIQHPNVVEVYELGEETGLPFMTMEYLNGQTLRQLAKRSSHDPDALPTGTLLSILAQAADGLHGAHETRDVEGHLLNIVHRDVSPDNILVGYDGVVKVLDFGIARARGRRTMTQVGQIKGKLEYLAPEQVSSDVDVDRRVDIWAMGVVAFEVLTGEAPFRGDDDRSTLWNLANRQAQSLRELRPDLPETLIDLIHSCLERERELRPVRCSAVARELREAAQQFGHDSASEIAERVTRAFSAEAAAARTRVARVLEGGVPTPVEELPRRPSHAPTAVENAPAARRKERESRKIPKVITRPPPKRRARWVVALLFAVLVATGLGIGSAWLFDAPPWTMEDTADVPEDPTFDRAGEPEGDEAEGAGDPEPPQSDMSTTDMGERSTDMSSEPAEGPEARSTESERSMTTDMGRSRVSKSRAQRERNRRARARRRARERAM